MSTSATVPAQDYHLSVEVEVDDVRQDWARCNLLANYLAEYSAYGFESIDKAENLISTVSNEIIEACVRSSPPGTTLALRFNCSREQLQFQCEFSPARQEAPAMSQALQDLQEGKARANYLEMLSSPLLDDQAAIKLSIAMLMNDFGARFRYTQSASTGIYLHVSVPTQELAS